MGLDKMKKTACGFCFVEYYSRADAENAMRYINGTRLDDRIIRTDWDAGFKEAGSMAVDDLGARYEMSIDRTMMLGEVAMENWPKTSEW